MQQYRRTITITAILGAAFIVMQVLAFKQLYQAGVRMEGSGAGQFLYIIFGLHALHVLGGVIALLVMFGKAFSSRVRNYNPVPVEVASTYWHFVDLLWIYLFVFFLFKI
jgi:cytochrome c oxidase subunit 3